MSFKAVFKTSASATDKFLPDFFLAVSLFGFVFQIFIVTVVETSYHATSSKNSSLLTLHCSMPAMSTTNKRLMQANIRALLLRSVESWVGIQNIMGYVLIADRKTLVPYDRTIAIDHRRS